MTARREFTAKTKDAAFQKSSGRCEQCTARLVVGKFQFDHRIADAMGGEPTLENCVVLCVACHSVKTTQQDVPAIAKVKRIRAKHIGAHRPRAPFPGGKGSMFKRKVSGETVLR